MKFISSYGETVVSKRKAAHFNIFEVEARNMFWAIPNESQDKSKNVVRIFTQSAVNSYNL